VVDANASHQQLGKRPDLRQVAIVRLQTLQLLLDEAPDYAFSFHIGKVKLTFEVFGKFDRFRPTESEGDTR